MKEIRIEIEKDLGGRIGYPKEWTQAHAIEMVLFALTRFATKGSYQEKKIAAMERALKTALIPIQTARECYELKKEREGRR